MVPLRRTVRAPATAAPRRPGALPQAGLGAEAVRVVEPVIAALVEGRLASGRRAVDVLILLFVALEGFSFTSSESPFREWKLSLGSRR